MMLIREITTIRGALRLGIGSLFIALGAIIGGKHWTYYERQQLTAWKDSVVKRFER